MIEVEGPDGTIYEFPDGTPQETMATALRKQYGGPATPPVPPKAPSVISDMAEAVPSGMVRGAVETASLPVTAARALTAGSDWLADHIMSGARSALGYEPLAPEDTAQGRDRSGTIGATLDSGQDLVRSIMDDHLYEPRTTPGKYAETVGEFLVPGGLPSRATRLATTGGRMALEYGADVARHAVVPALASEAAGQATEGTAYEPAARIAGAVVGNFAGAAGKAAVAPEMIVRRAIGNGDDIDWERAVGLQDNTTGVRLSGPEAITQAQNGASALPDLLRVVEGSVEGRAATAPFFAQRPGQVDTAVQGVLDRINPPSAAPSLLGPRAAEAAETSLDRARQDINAQTRPLYQAAEPQLIPDTEFAPIAADPRFQSALARLRGNDDLAPDYAGQPDNSIAVVDAVTKDMAARGEALANRANPLYGPELAAKNAQGASSARDIARTAVPEYDQALSVQHQQRRDVLQPLQEGPLGRVAAANDTQTAGNAILPQNPMVGSQGETGDAVRRLMAEDPDTTRGVVRQNLADRYSKASTETQGGDGEFVGAKFRKDVAGNQQRRDTLDEVIDAINRPEAREAMPELLDVLLATGRRKPIGSATAFNNTTIGEMSAGGPLSQAFGAARTLGTSLFTTAGDSVRRAAYRNSLSDLADMFVDPQSVQRIQRAVATGAPIALPEASARALAQILPLFTRENLQR